MNGARLLNLGCGSRSHADWVNADINPSAPGILPLDLGNDLPFASDSFTVVYHSHVLEHLPRYRVPAFLKECYRVLTPGGVLRVVVPDLERIARLYLELLEGAIKGDVGSQERYGWIVLELFDQMVRNESGGEMLKYWKQDPMPAQDFVIERVGSEVLNFLQTLRTGPASAASQAEHSLLDDPAKIGKFRLSGEVHWWMYDRYSLACLLERAGFISVRRCNADESSIRDFNSYLLDIEQDGSIRKPDSLFMEAVKPNL